MELSYGRSVYWLLNGYGQHFLLVGALFLCSSTPWGEDRAMRCILSNFGYSINQPEDISVNKPLLHSSAIPNLSPCLTSEAK